ncbi:serine hydrolase domain-containing protein [Nonlabens marinus]|uniref:Beta-lactamase class C and other penicillin binding proteins n=1 Tax=Nonlabens marinus S1-08 TaxID=1454201 RepID=W8VWP1_9FLAO|nr:serine hydrolase domain-containing protein [Nonlabens marinus]BAO56503.1 beta-lactamase class C and other penicillin binding proteins [Nonlabens marinus S1-08]
MKVLSYFSHFRILGSVFLCLACPTALLSQGYLKLEKEVRKIAADEHFPSLDIIAWSPKDSVIINYHDPATQDIDTYGIGSATKMLVGTFVLHLIEKGKLQLNDEIGQLLELPNKSPYATITVRQLLQHTSGIPDYTRNSIWLDQVIKGTTPTSFKERFQLIPNKLHPLNKFYYSNSNYLFLEQIVEKVERIPYDKALNDFYKNLGLEQVQLQTGRDSTQTFFAQDNTGTNDVTATQETYGYAGDVHTTSHTLLQFMVKMFVEQSIIEPGSIQQLQQWVSMDAMKIPVGEGFITHYGNGLMKLDYKEQLWIGHAGGTLKYQSFVFFNPSDSTVLIALTNASGSHYTNAFVQKLIPAVLDKL